MDVDEIPAALTEPALNDDYALIERVAVRPAHQRRGLARRLLDQAELVASSSGRRRSGRSGYTRTGGSRGTSRCTSGSAIGWIAKEHSKAEHSVHFSKRV
ncbi:GNAT family N-acetyltransferase [Burkholderia oklahomensis]|nr:GNAT family N-acetyltransferase [Burkholderia oklahomensis]QPS40143.1 GNAT family N-acetyltransferase [Burkholderia oklahomensis]